MRTVVITGSSRGIGCGLANAFLDLGCGVTVSGKTINSTRQAVASLSERHPADRIFAHPCDVTQPDQAESLWDRALAHFGKVDIWINNAGIANPSMKLWELTPEEIKSVVDTNVLGTLYGSRVAIRGMLRQGFGSIYQMEGLGSDGRRLEGLSIYGATKYTINYITQALIEESRNTPLLVGSIRPGMVLTDMIEGQYQKDPEKFAQAERFFRLIGDRVETVTPWLAEKILANTKTGVQISWLTRWKFMGRMISAFILRGRIPR